jgi:cell division protein FtsB
MKNARDIIVAIAAPVYAARRNIATVVLVALAVWMAIHAVISPNGVMAYEKKKVEYRELQKEVQSLHDQNTRIQDLNKSLKENDPKVIEKEAREQLRYAKPGERVYVVPEPKTDPPKPPEIQSAEKQPAR